ncbi:monocarboxylate transporter 12-like [Asterias amurensis]|uniref:monocarboxylate transporter 12-like n=1 Tax=Asterias amurensis TaxID=7602 RepID=UPI003AB71444
MVSGCFERVLISSVDTFRDGGLHGWIAVLGLFTSRLAWNVLVKCLGMMLPTLQEQFVTSTWLIGWMVAFVDAGVEGSGVIATPLMDRFGARTVVTVCGLVAGISVITASFLSSLYGITFILTIFTGPAFGISYVITKNLIGSYFSKSITTAYGLSTLGSSFTFFVVPLIQLFLDIYGWRGTWLLLGGWFLNLAVVGALMKPPAASGSRDGYEPAHTDEEQYTGEDKLAPNNRFGCSYFIRIFSSTRDTFQLGLFSSISFLLIVLNYSVWQLFYSAWIIYYVQYTTVSKGFTLEDASQFIIAYGVGRTFACLLIGPLVQSVQAVSTHTWLAGALLLSGVYYAVDPWLTSYWPIVANSLMFGFFYPVTSILMDVVVKEIFGKEQMGHVFGWLGLVSGLAKLLLLYFPGLMYDLTGDYTVVFSLMAGAQSLTVFATLGLSWRQKYHISSSEASS